LCSERFAYAAESQLRKKEISIGARGGNSGLTGVKYEETHANFVRTIGNSIEID
jgi:hypothetical protein